VGAPEGNKNRQTHGLYAIQPAGDINEAITNLWTQISKLSDMLTEADDADTFVKLFGLHAQAISRYGRLLRDQAALGGKADLLDLLGDVLDQIGQEYGIDL
jgi:hypothetical protein